MSKKEFVERFATKSGESKKRAEELVNAFLHLVQETLVEGDDVQFVGWGSFTTKEKEARKGRNPRTGQDINIPAKKVIKFRVGKKLSDAVSNK